MGPLGRGEHVAVLSAQTDVMALQMLGDAAVLTHSIETHYRTTAGEEVARERETIVFARQSDGRWLVVHEHVSPQP
jgi:ketosteroid isomerase-like protein